MPILISFKKSPKKDKKYVMVFRNPRRTLHLKLSLKVEVKRRKMHI